MPAAYFSPATFRFLKALDRNNSREWFLDHKKDYEQHVREPFLALIADMQALTDHAGPCVWAPMADRRARSQAPCGR